MDDELLKLMVRLQRYGLTVTRDVASELVKVLNAALDNLEGDGVFTVDDARIIQQAIGNVSHGLTANITSTIKESIDATTEASLVASQRAFVAGALPYAHPPLMAISIIKQADFAGKSWSQYSEAMTQRTAKHVVDALRDGLREGESVPDIRKRVRSITKLTASDATTLVRTSINSASNRSLMTTYQANADIIKGWRFVSTLDQRTSLICAGLSGQEFPMSDQTNLPPRHPNCRSVALPITRTPRELGLDVGELPVGTRASQTGEVPANWNYEQWLNSQDTDFQKETLGNTRYQIWKSGVPLSGFASSNAPYSVDQLRASYAV